MKGRFRRFVAVVLVLLIAFQFPSGDISSIGNALSKVFAAEIPAYSINLGTGVLETGEDDRWSEDQGNTVYYGRGINVAYSGGMSYRVLKNDGNTMLLDCAKTFASESYLRSYSEFGIWENSTPQLDMNREIENKLQLEDIEAANLVTTTHPGEQYATADGGTYTSAKSSDKVFALSAEEAETYYADQTSRSKGGAYWLRSNYNSKEMNGVNTYVAQDGTISPVAEGTYAVSPAFQIRSSISNVLFTSTVTGKNRGLQKPETVTGNHEWALTLLAEGAVSLENEELTVNTAAGSTEDTEPVDEGEETVTWTAGATVKDINSGGETVAYSILITDKAYTAEDARIKWYGQIATMTDGEMTVVGFDLPSDYKTTDHVYILAEKDYKNGIGEVYLSHATKPLEIDLGICQVTIDSGNTHLKTTDKEIQTCYPKAGYHTSVQAVYTVEDGYYIPADYSVKTQAGIQVKRLSSTKLQVSGTPTAAAVTVTLDAAVKKGEQPAPKGLTTEYISGGAAKIVGTTAKMEYVDAAMLEADAKTEWIACSEGETIVARGKTYLVRYKASSSKVSGAAARVEIKDARLLTVKNPADSHLIWDKTSGQESQIVEAGAALTDIVYRAEDGYYIPADYSISTSGDVKIVRESAETIRIQAGQISEDAEIRLDAALQQQPGDGSVTQADYYYGAAAPAPELKSETNGTENAVITYKKAAEPDTSYTSEIPTQVGTYTIRAIFPAVGEYAQVTATSEFTIQYLPTPEHPYSVTGTKGENNYYISAVTVVPADGYLISSARDGAYTETLAFEQDTDVSYIYLKKQATGEQTDGIAMEAIKVDPNAPAITAVKDGETYYKDTIAVVISDKHLSRIQLNDDQIEVNGTEMTLTLASNHGEEEYQILAEDEAGNVTRVTVTVAAPWMKKGTIPTGERIRLKSQQAYSFGVGTWQVSGDTTSYTGGRSFYVKSDGEYTFMKKN